MRRARVHTALLLAVCGVALAGFAVSGQASTDWTGEQPATAAPSPSPAAGLNSDAVFRPGDVPPRAGDPVRGSILDPVPQPVDDIGAEVQRLASLDAATTAPVREPTCGQAQPATAPTCAAASRQCYAVVPVQAVRMHAVASAAPVRVRVPLLARLRARRAAARAAVCSPAAVCQPVTVAPVAAAATCGG